MYTRIITPFLVSTINQLGTSTPKHTKSIVVIASLPSAKLEMSSDHLESASLSRLRRVILGATIPTIGLPVSSPRCILVVPTWGILLCETLKRHLCTCINKLSFTATPMVRMACSLASTGHAASTLVTLLYPGLKAVLSSLGLFQRPSLCLLIA